MGSGVNGKRIERKCQTEVTRVLSNDRHSCAATALRWGETFNDSRPMRDRRQNKRTEVRKDS